MPLKTSEELLKESLKTLKKFQSGELKPLSTGKPHLDEALLGGLMPSLVLGICALSSHGKTWDWEDIRRNLEINDTNGEIVFVECAWEMEHFKLFVRDISASTGKSVKRVLFEEPESEEEKKKFNEVYKRHKKKNHFYQNEPVSAEVFHKDVDDVINHYPNNKIIVSIDNLENVLVEKGDQKKAMDAILSTINKLKKTHPFICFIILNQLNGDILDRLENPKAHRPIEKDIYGTGQLQKLCDVLYVKVIPWKMHIREKFMVFGRNQYSWLNEHKISTSNSKTASFDPFGRAFYFYLKLRQPDDPKNIRDLFIEVMFTKEEAGFEELEQMEDIPKIQDPKFEAPNSPEIVVPRKQLPINTNFDIPNEDESPF